MVIQILFDKESIVELGAGPAGSYLFLPRNRKKVSLKHFSCYLCCVVSFIDGLLCFTIRDSELDDYQGKMLELEKEGRWENVSKKTMPLYESDGMPKEVFGYIYRVLRN